MINPTAVIMQTQQGNYPPSWRVYQGKGDYGCVSVSIVFAIVFLILFCLLFFSGIFEDPSILFPSFMFLGVPCIICAMIAQNAKVNTNARFRSLLVILPEGVVQSLGGDVNNPAWLYFPNIIRLELIQKTEVNGNEDGFSTYYHYSLDVYDRDGNYFQFQVWNGFGDAEILSKTIIAAYGHYWNQN